MKKALLIVSLFLGLCASSQSKVKVDANGNFISLTKPKGTTKATGKTFTDSKGNVWPVFVSDSGKYYALRKSKSGAEYKQYLKVN